MLVLDAKTGWAVLCSLTCKTQLLICVPSTDLLAITSRCQQELDRPGALQDLSKIGGVAPFDMLTGFVRGFPYFCAGTVAGEGHHHSCCTQVAHMRSEPPACTISFAFDTNEHWRPMILYTRNPTRLAVPQLKPLFSLRLPDLRTSSEAESLKFLHAQI